MHEYAFVMSRKGSLDCHTLLAGILLTENTQVLHGHVSDQKDNDEDNLLERPDEQPVSVTSLSTYNQCCK